MDTRRLASRMDTNPAPLNALLSQARPGQRESVSQISEALQGWRKAPSRKVDPFAASLASQVHDGALRNLNAVFGDGGRSTH